MNASAEFPSEDRRAFMSRVARQYLGVSVAGSLASVSAAGALAKGTSQTPPGKAKHIIYLFMDGGMSHLDTFDPKVGVEEAGETKPIPTRIAGVQFGERFPKLAYLAGALAVVRSLNTETGAHAKGRYLMRTAYKQLNSIQHPAMGAWMLSQRGRLNQKLPGNYLIGSNNRHPGAGFLEPSLSPVPIADPEDGLKNTELPDYLDEKIFERRLTLAAKLDRPFQAHRENHRVEAYNQLYAEARNLMGSEHLKVFDLKEEPQKVRDTYGDNRLGQGCLLARRLVQAGARFVEVNDGGWDMHRTLYDSLETRAERLDTALSSLLRDLHSKGLLDETLVVLTTEFGRKPKLNANAGRDHHPGVFSSLLAGAGIRAGQVYGASDNKGDSVDSDGVSVSDFNKTIAAAAGLPTEEEIFAPNGRPFKIGGDGQPVEALLS